MHAFDKLMYYSFAFLTRSAQYLGKPNKNSFLFQKKRQYLLRVIPDSKLLSETAGAAHVLYHPEKTEKDIKSIKEFLASLVKECKKRGLSNNTVAWAERLIQKDYSYESPGKNPGWKPDMQALGSAHALFKKRVTTRYVSEGSFDKEILYKLIDCAVEAPSSCNKQGWRFILIEDKEKIEKIAIIKNQMFLKRFPYIIICCFDKDVYMGLDIKETPFLDMGAAIMNLCNAAAATDLAVCWCNFTLSNVGKKRHEELRSLLNIDERLIPVSLVALGIPGKVPEKPPREGHRYYMPMDK